MSEEKKAKVKTELPKEAGALQAHSLKLQEGLRKKRFDLTLGQLTDTSSLKKDRVELARTLTALRALSQQGQSK